MELEIDSDNDHAMFTEQVTTAAASRAFRQGADNDRIDYFVVNAYDTSGNVVSYTYETQRVYATYARGRVSNQQGTDRNITLYRFICRGNRTIGSTAISGGASTTDKTIKKVEGVAAQRVVAVTDFTSAAIDVDDGSSGATITATGGTTPFSIFSASDYIYVTGAEQDDHDGFYTLSAATNTVLTITGNMSGTDNAADTALTIHLIARNAFNVEWEYCGLGGGDILDVRFTPNTIEGVGVTEWPGKHWKIKVDFDSYSSVFSSYIDDDAGNAVIPGFAVIYGLTEGEIAVHTYQASKTYVSGHDGARTRERGESQPTSLEFVCIGTRAVTYPS